MKSILCALLFVVAFTCGITLGLGEVRAGWLDKTGREKGCQCLDYNCGCCFHLDVAKLHLNDTGCVNVSYVKANIGVDLTVTVDGRVIIHEEVSVRNPPALCVAIPYLKNLAKLCVQLYNLTLQPGALYGCLKIKVKVAEVVEQNIDLGCFQLPIPQSSLAGREGQMTLGQDLTFDPKVRDALLQLLGGQAGGQAFRAGQGVEGMVMERFVKGFQAWSEKQRMSRSEGQSGQE